ncbi:hypothetical protein VTK26DRAFT_1758 [Humicola hyalothermophila]
MPGIKEIVVSRAIREQVRSGWSNSAATLVIAGLFPPSGRTVTGLARVIVVVEPKNMNRIQTLFGNHEQTSLPLGDH